MEVAAIVVVIVFAVGFDYTNGFHDAANAIATSARRPVRAGRSDRLEPGHLALRHAVLVVARPDRGLVGAGLASAGTVKWNGVLEKVVVPMVVSPLVGFLLAGLLMVALLWLFRRGWRIMRTLGRRIIDLDPPHGFAAEATASALLYTTAFAFAAPISTTQTITSSILGVGATRHLSAVRWIVARDIVLAWVLTIPMAALAAAATFTVLQLVFF